jgi:hypothetical protein
MDSLYVDCDKNICEFLLLAKKKRKIYSTILSWEERNQEFDHCYKDNYQYK